MNLSYVPLLGRQRELLAVPRGPERFRHYLAVTLTPGRDALALTPMVVVNPMAKDHVAAVLDGLIAFDADGHAARAVAAAEGELGGVPGEFRVSLVVADDAQGGWTNRWATDHGLRFDFDPHNRRFWVTAVVWSSDQPGERGVREAVAAAVFRTAHVVRHGPARTLGEKMRQEGYALSRAGCDGPTLDAEDVGYTRAVLEPLLGTTDVPTAVACLWGDAAARSLGFAAHGLSDGAGLAVALADIAAAGCRL